MQLTKKETTITQKGQVTIPIEVRRALGLKPRDKVEFELDIEEKTVKLRPASSKVERWFGSVTPKKRPEDFKELRTQFEQGVAEEVAAETR